MAMDANLQPNLFDNIYLMWRLEKTRYICKYGNADPHCKPMSYDVARGAMAVGGDRIWEGGAERRL